MQSTIPAEPSAAERTNQVLTIMARTLAQIVDQLQDLLTLTQQQTDILRRLVQKEDDVP
jgi:hypothetical protein